MKTIEEKAKAYDEALKRARNLYKDAIDMGENIRAKQCEIIFPELKESEDEKVRKALIDFFNKGAENGEQTNGVCDKDILAFLEKQGEIIFPELNESEDERIRKALIDYFDDANKADENPLQSYGIHTDKAIAWLEKQGEQKHSLAK